MNDGTLEIHEESGGKKNMKKTRTIMKEISTDVLFSRTYDVLTGRTLRVETTTLLDERTATVRNFFSRRLLCSIVFSPFDRTFDI